MCIFVSLFLFFITASPKLSLLVTSGVLALFSTVNNYVFLFRGSELCPTDILSIGTAANVAANYKVVPTPPVIYGWLFLILYWCFLLTLPKVQVSRKAFYRTASILLLVVCSFAFRIGVNGIRVYHFMQGGSVLNGYLLNFSSQIQETIVEKPEGYNPQNLIAEETKYIELEDDEDLPDIFVVMDESYADLSILGAELRTNTEVDPFISSLTDNTIKGYALSSVFGGGTPNSEYEFLYGNSLLFLPPGAIVYQQYIKKPTYTMISDLKELGYRCISMHPYLSDGWERKSVYPRLGYDESYFLEDYPQKKIVREYVSDQEAFEEIMRRYRDCKEVSEKNTFMFLVTMQNHGGYEYEGENYNKTIELEGYANEYPEAEQYLSLLHETDSAVEWLVNYLQKLDHKAVLVFYGDHLPWLDERLFEEIHGGEFMTLDEQQLEKTVPFFIWANYDIEEENVELTSFNYLSNYMYKASGIELPAYNQFLADINKELPCMNSAGYFSKEADCFKTYEEADGDEALLLNNYYQFIYNCMFDDKERNNYFFPLPQEE